MTASARRKFKHIGMLINENNAEVKDPEGLKDVAKRYFDGLFLERQCDYAPVLNPICRA